MFGCLGYLFFSLVLISVLFGNPKQIPGWAASEWSLYSPTVLWKQTQAQGQVLLLSRQFFPTSSALPFSIDFHSFNLELPSPACQKERWLRFPPANIRNSAKKKKEISSLPFPPVAWSIFKWSTVICRISAFSNLADPFKIRSTTNKGLKVLRALIWYALFWAPSDVFNFPNH